MWLLDEDNSIVVQGEREEIPSARSTKRCAGKKKANVMCRSRSDLEVEVVAFGVSEFNAVLSH